MAVRYVEENMIGVIVANTGSPAAPEPDAIEGYLREYLMDERIRQLPKPLWKWLLHRRILPKRKETSAQRYRFIWTEEGSPLVVNARVLAEKVERLYEASGEGASAEDGCERVVVRSAMSYGSPSIDDTLVELRALGVDRVVLLPFYPQSAYSPTLAVVDAFDRAREAIGWHPQALVVNNYHDDPGYIDAMVRAIRGVGFDAAAGDRLMFSFHAIPLKDEAAGDRYRAQIARSTELIADGLGISAQDVTVSFQSVFGRDKSKWTSPLSLEILEGWRDDAFRVVFACPGFAIDCLETLYDIPHEMVPALEGPQAAPVVEHVGSDVQGACNTSGRFVWVPTLNTSDEHAALVKGVIDRALSNGSFQ